MVGSQPTFTVGTCQRRHRTVAPHRGRCTDAASPLLPNCCAPPFAARHGPHIGATRRTRGPGGRAWGGPRQRSALDDAASGALPRWGVVPGFGLLLCVLIYVVLRFGLVSASCST